MKFDDQFPNGEMPPFSDLRRHLYYSGFTFKCSCCRAPTNWIVMAMQTMVCSEECLISRIEQKATGVLTTAFEEISRWLQEKGSEIPNGDGLPPSSREPLPGPVPEPTKP